MRLGALLEGAWDQRIPRDTQGRVFLDESPLHLIRLVDTAIERQGSPGETSTPSFSWQAGKAVNTHDTTYMKYLENFLKVSLSDSKLKPLCGSNTSVRGESVNPSTVEFRGVLR